MKQKCVLWRPCFLNHGNISRDVRTFHAQQNYPSRGRSAGPTHNLLVQPCSLVRHRAAGRLDQSQRRKLGSSRAISDWSKPVSSCAVGSWLRHRQTLQTAMQSLSPTCLTSQVLGTTCPDTHTYSTTHHRTVPSLQSAQL